MIHEDKQNTQNKAWVSLKNKSENSAILRFIFFLAEVLYKKLGRSITALIFTAYEKCQAYYEKSLFYNIFVGGSESGLKKIFGRIKKFIVLKCENGRMIKAVLKFTDGILASNLRSMGVLVLSWGFYSTIIYLLKLFILKQIETADAGVFVGPAIILLSLPMLFSKQKIYDALKNSVIVDAIVFEFLGFAEKSLDGSEDDNISDYGESNESKKKNIIFYSIGMVLGLCTYFTSPILICAMIASVIFLYLLLCKPEIGIFGMILGLPFLPTMALAGFGILVTVCYFSKLIRGKRVFKFEIIDLCVAIFCLTMLFSGVVSVSRTGSLRPALLYTCFALMYFTAVNMVRSKEMIVKCIICLIFAGFLTAAYGVYQNFFGVSDTTWQDTSMFAGITGRVVSTFENPNVLAEYLILAIPFCIVSVLLAKKAQDRMTSLFCLVFSLLCLIYTWSRGSWLGFIFSALILFIIINKKSIAVYLGILFTVPLLPVVLPESIVKRFTSIGNLGDSSTSYRVSIWTASIKMIKDFFLSGIGVGQEAFKMVYPEYSLAGIESAPHSHSLYLQICVESGILGLLALILVIFFFLQYCFTAIAKAGEKELKLFISAGMCAIIGFVLNGFTDFVWYNYRVYFMFWLVVAITVAMCRFSLKNQTTNDSLYQ